MAPRASPWSRYAQQRGTRSQEAARRDCPPPLAGVSSGGCAEVLRAAPQGRSRRTTSGRLAVEPHAVLDMDLLPGLQGLELSLLVQQVQQIAGFHLEQRQQLLGRVRAPGDLFLHVVDEHLDGLLV